MRGAKTDNAARVSDDRVAAVCEHARKWLFAKKKIATPPDK